MEIGTLELIVGAFVAMTSLMVAGFRLLLRRMDTVNLQNDARHKQDIKERDELNKRLMDEINVLRRRVQELETSERTRKDELEATRKELNAVCTTLEDLQKRLSAAEAREADKDRAIEQQRTEIKRLERDNETLSRDKERLQIANATYEKAFALAGLNRMVAAGERREDEKPEAKPEGGEQLTDDNKNEEKADG